MKLSSILAHPTTPITNFYTPSMKGSDKAENRKNNPELVAYYLEFAAIANAPAVKKIEKAPKIETTEYKNNMKTMIQNNESVMLAIVPRTFTAEDLDGDEMVSLSKGEKQGTLLSAIDRLDELKDLGINTLHILPIHLSKEK